MIADAVLVAVVVGFAWNLGAHYTGAVMGMPYASRAIATGPALALIGIFTVLGATFASGGVQQTVGLRIVDARLVTVPDAIAIVLAAGALTALYNYLRMPTSTIQILVFCVVGVGLAARIPVSWRTIARLAALWAAAPLAACALGFLFTRLLDLIVPVQAARAQAAGHVVAATATGRRAEAASGLGASRWRAMATWFPAAARPLSPEVQAQAKRANAPAPAISLWALRWLPALLVLVGIAASFVLGANDVSNATGVLIATSLFPITLAGLIGGAAMAVGALTWGGRILRTVAFDTVRMDLAMASAAQGVQALVVLAAVSQGLFTSMNQALIGAMAGAGLARGEQTVRWTQLRRILLGWVIGPVSGIVLAAGLELLVRLAGLVSRR